MGMDLYWGTYDLDLFILFSFIAILSLYLYMNEFRTDHI